MTFLSRPVVADLLCIAGVVALAAGAALIYRPLGLIVVGGALLWAGLHLDGA